jgi:alpha-1,2-mannosyltransferase
MERLILLILRSKGFYMFATLFRDRAAEWLMLALAIGCLICVCTTPDLMVGRSVKDVLKATLHAHARILQRKDLGQDSWRPMIAAYNSNSVSPERGLYSVFFADKIKFQYPPSALLILDLFPAALLDLKNVRFQNIVGQASSIAGYITIVISILILELGLRQRSADSSTVSASVFLRVLLALMLGSSFYPLVQAHLLGQLQIYLDLSVACAILLHMIRLRVIPGICIGLCCLVKPQYGLVLFWGLLRRHWSFSLSMGSVILAGVSLSLIQFRWFNYVDYLSVLRTIGMHGEVYWPNQSVNGLLNRFLLNGNPVIFDEHGFQAFNMTVYTATMCSSLIILVVALCQPRRRAKTNNYNLIDFIIVLLASNLASPVAWEHHYGILLPICSVLLPILLHSSPLGQWAAPFFAIGYALISNVFIRQNLYFVFANRWLGLIGSHLFFGSIIIFFILLAVRSATVLNVDP